MERGSTVVVNMERGSTVVVKTNVGRIYPKHVAKIDDDHPLVTNLEVYVKRRVKVTTYIGDRARQPPAHKIITSKYPDTICGIQPSTYSDMASLKAELHRVLVGELCLKLGEDDLSKVSEEFIRHVSNAATNSVVAEFLNLEKHICYWDVVTSHDDFDEEYAILEELYQL